MPEFDFASEVEEREPYYIVLKRKRDQQGNIIEEDKVLLPPVLPADLMLQFFDKDRKELEKMAGSPRDQIQVGLKVIERLVGKEEWERVLHTIGFSNINPLLTDVFKYYGLGANEEEGEAGEGKEATEEKAEPSPSTPSSTTLAQSTPISNGSTPTPGVDSTEDDSTGTSSSPVSPIYPPSRSL